MSPRFVTEAIFVMEMEEVFIDKRYIVTVEDLRLLGMVEFVDEEHFIPTEKGCEHAKSIMDKLPLADQIMIILANQLDETEDAK